MNLFYQPNFQETSALTDDEAFHAVKVLRVQVGELIRVTDGVGHWFEGSIEKANPKACVVRILHQETLPPRPYSIELIVAPTKNLDRMEWLVEKATEIGVNKFSFVYTAHSERRVMKLERLQKIAVSAMKQSLQAHLPALIEVSNFKEYLKNHQASQKFIAHLSDNSPPVHLFKAAKPQKSYAVLIGPEGDFSNEEIEIAVSNDFEMVTLGNTRLRTETAALVACQTLHICSLREAARAVCDL